MLQSGNTWLKSFLISLISGKEVNINKLFKHIEKFTNLKFSNDNVRRAIKSCSFENLKKMEEKNKIFFNLGPKNNWENLLSNKIRMKIEKFFEKEMRELGYI